MGFLDLDSKNAAGHIAIIFLGWGPRFAGTWPERLEALPKIGEIY
jgi:hypothetical protein